MRRARAHAPGRRTRAGVLVGLVLATLLVVLILGRYPGAGAAVPGHLGLGAAALGALLGLAAWVARWGARTARDDAAAHRRGVAAGLLGGLLWVLEIGFNNVPPPTVSTGRARFVVDNGAWAAIALIIAGAAATSAFRARRVGAGVRAGWWAGLVSGLLACLTGLLLVAAGMRLLLRDPLLIAEYAARGPASGAPDLATYVAYETLAGALGHLLVLGLALGALLGALGGLLGCGLAAARSAAAGGARPGTPPR